MVNRDVAYLLVGSSQLPTTAERAVIKSLSTVQTTKQCSDVVVSWEEPLNVWLTAAKNSFVGWALNFRVRMLLKSAVMTTATGTLENVLLLLFSLLSAKATTEVNTVFPVNFHIFFHEFCPYSDFFTQCIFEDSSSATRKVNLLFILFIWFICFQFHLQSQNEPLKITKLHIWQQFTTFFSVLAFKV